jgi:hypothetical protein
MSLIVLVLTSGCRLPPRVCVCACVQALLSKLGSLKSVSKEEKAALMQQMQVRAVSPWPLSP